MAKLFNLFGNKKKIDVSKTADAVIDEEELVEEEIDIIPDTEPTRGVFVALPEMRVKDICGRYLYAEKFEESELNSLDVAELSHIILNAEFAVEYQYKDDEEKSKVLNSRREQMYALILEKLEKEDFYIIYSKRTRTPFFIKDGALLLYQQDFRAKEAVEYLNFKNKAQGTFSFVKFTSENKSKLFPSIKAMGADLLCIEGSKFHVKLSEIDHTDYTDVMMNGHVCLGMELAMQGAPVMSEETKRAYAINLASELISAGKTFLLPVDKEDQEEGKLLVRAVKDTDNKRWLPVFTDQYAFDEFFKDVETVGVLDSIENSYYGIATQNDDLEGFIVNPGRENYHIMKGLIAAVMDANKKMEASKADKFYVVYSKALGSNYPGVNARNQIFVFTNEDSANRVVNDTPEMNLFVKEFSKDEFIADLKRYYPLGINNILLNGTATTRDEFLGAEADKNKDLTYLGSEVCRIMIQFGQVAAIEKKEFRGMSMAYWGQLSQAIPNQLYLVPMVYDNESVRDAFDDNELHFTQKALDILNSKLSEKEGSLENFQELFPFFGGEAFKPAQTAESKVMHFRKVGNQTEEFIAAFTDAVTMRNLFGDKIRVAVATYDDIVALTDECAGLVINPGGNSFAINKVNIKNIEAARNAGTNK